MYYKLLSFILLAQFASAANPIRRFEDIEIGMSAISVAAELVQQGYTVSKPVEGVPGRLVGLNGKRVGVFYVDKDGHVDGAEKNIYSVDSSKSDGPIEFAEALFWLVRDEGTPVPSDSKNQKAASVAAVLTADEIESRLPGQTFRRIFIETKSGAKYRLTLNRDPGGRASDIEIHQLAPFPAK
ncbi:MAG: hypothetical protein LAO55_27135 [Acidobacteriia bacterium]|nr:hypothetical protein [Terriglobia bacterium]